MVLTLVLDSQKYGVDQKNLFRFVLIYLIFAMLACKVSVLKKQEFWLLLLNKMFWTFIKKFKFFEFFDILRSIFI